MPILAATAVTALVAGLAVTDSAAARPASSKLSPGIKTSAHSLAGAKDKLAGRLPAGVPKKGNSAFLLRLSTRPTAAVYNATRRSAGKSAARSAAKSQLASVRAAQNDVIAALPSKSKVLYRTHAALAGVAVVTNVHNFAALRALRGVAAVYPIARKTRSNSYAVPLQGAPQGWEAYGDLGQNSTVAVIDTGVDYTHANFNGEGTPEAYEAAKLADTVAPAPESFDPAKFGRTGADGLIGMFDFAGDAYDSGSDDPAISTPAPDPNPLDCNSHGSHVAGTVAGYGENADGSTYTGPYDTSTPFDTMRIGPGMAPRARLYAYKVFGCEGSTNVVGEAIDRALDPNGDGSTSDHVNVINMSLGADYASPQDGDSVISDLASALGIAVVASAGNGGDVYDVGGSPGDARRVIGVAASADAHSLLDGVAVTIGAGNVTNYGATRSILYDWETKPDLVGTVVAPAANKTACSAFSDADKLTLSGKVALVEWDQAAVTAGTECGSIARGANLVAAGATGFIFADNVEDFANNGINGSDTIPGVLVVKSAGDTIRAALALGTTVTVSGTSVNSVSQILPENNDTLADFSSRGIRGAGNVKPDVTAVGLSVVSTGMGTGNDPLNISGTSMASPMVAGTAALVTSRHQDWSPEQVKADIMNTAGQDLFTGLGHTGDRYAPNRVGAGRIQVKKALDNSVLAYVRDDPGVVSASFGPLAITPSSTPTVLRKTITVQNTGNTLRTYDVSYQARTSVPGAVYTVSPGTVSVDPRSSTTVTLTLTVDPSLLTKTMDPTVEATQAGVPREFLADASGLVVFDSGDVTVPSLRVPVYSAPRPASAMSQAASLTLPSGRVQQALLPLTGTQVNQGSGSAKVESTVAGFELQARSGAAPQCSVTVLSGCVGFPDDRSADLKYVGVTSDAPQLRSIGQDPTQDGMVYFSITTRGPWRTAASAQEFDIFIDTNGDGAPDLVTFNTRLPDSDVIIDETLELTSGTNAVVDAQPINARFGDTDTALFDSDTLVLPVAISGLGLAATSRIKYAVFAFGNDPAVPVDQVGDINDAGNLVHPLSFNVLYPGVAVFGSYNGDSSPLLFADSPGAVLDVRRGRAAYAADHGLGALLVHFHNTVGNKAQVMALKTAPTVSLEFSPSPAHKRKLTRATVAVSPSSGIAATGKVWLVRLTGPNAPRTVGNGAVINGKAVVKFRPRRLGDFKYRAVYSGDSNYVARNSARMRLRVIR